jgi:hypothetical protein
MLVHCGFGGFSFQLRYDPQQEPHDEEPAAPVPSEGTPAPVASEGTPATLDPDRTNYDELYANLRNCINSFRNNLSKKMLAQYQALLKEIENSIINQI